MKSPSRRNREMEDDKKTGWRLARKETGRGGLRFFGSVSGDLFFSPLQRGGCQWTEVPELRCLFAAKCLYHVWSGPGTGTSTGTGTGSSGTKCPLQCRDSQKRRGVQAGTPESKVVRGGVVSEQRKRRLAGGGSVGGESFCGRMGGIDGRNRGFGSFLLLLSLNDFCV